MYSTVQHGLVRYFCEGIVLFQCYLSLLASGFNALIDERHFVCGIPLVFLLAKK